MLTPQQKSDLEFAIAGVLRIESDPEILRQHFLNREAKWERLFRQIGELVLVNVVWDRTSPFILVWTGYETLTDSSYAAASFRALTTAIENES